MIDIGIVGLEQSGRTTLFRALTKGKADTGDLASNVGIAQVPEPRLQTLAAILHPRKVVPAEVRYHDISAAAKGPVAEKGISGQYLAQLSNADALINVVRAFADPSIPHVAGSLDIKRDIATMALELVFSDIGIIDRRLEKIEVSLKGAKQLERQGLLQEKDMLAKIKTDLEKDIPIREMKLSPAEVRALTSFQFLSAKPLLIVINIGEDQVSQATSWETELNSQYARPYCRVITLCSKLEMELAQLEPEAAAEFRAEFGIKESRADRIIELSSELLGLISFFTIASGEIKAWSIRNGTSALKAAGKIHSDMERGFIRAEVISHSDLMKCGSIAEARKKGLLRLEGKDYTVKNGDVITFLFNI
ncbi:MAG: redox-regulated ATPase YchF [Dehalococcoidales bacterium]|nr:redox-regulated ATPase YchF [Dehalococcoidales bacterium]